MKNQECPQIWAVAEEEDEKEGVGTEENDCPRVTPRTALRIQKAMATLPTGWVNFATIVMLKNGSTVEQNCYNMGKYL
jgi:hypothetical protein